MSEQFDFECPFCKQAVGVSDSSVGQMVDCPHCERQFQAQAPLGRAIGTTDRHASPKSESHSDAERVLREVHPVVLRNHLFSTGLFVILALVGVVALGYRLAGSTLLGLEGMPLLIVGGLGLLVAVGYFLYQWVHKIGVRLTVTTSRTIITRGIVTRQTNEVQHDDVRNIKCDQNVLERMLRYGDISLSSAGQGDMEIVVQDVPDPQGIIEIVRSYQ